MPTRHVQFDGGARRERPGVGKLGPPVRALRVGAHGMRDAYRTWA
ncbi:hypothetical protein [Tomitella cavernea]